MDEQAQECVYCNEPLRPKGFYCPKCAKQVRCKECREILEKDANACIYCGSEVTAKIDSMSQSGTSPTMNEVEYHETKSSRSLRARFTDNVGSSITVAIGSLLGKGTGLKPPQSKFEKGPLIEDSSAEIISDNSDSFLSLATTDSSFESSQSTQLSSPEIDQISRIFRFEEEKTVLIETRLKAHNKIDYVRRLVLLLLYGHRLMGKSLVLRSEVTKMLIDTGLNYGGARDWLANNGLMRIDDEAKTVEIIIPGVEQAKIFLADINSSEVENKWSITTQSKPRKKNKQADNQSEE